MENQHTQLRQPVQPSDFSFDPTSTYRSEVKLRRQNSLLAMQDNENVVKLEENNGQGEEWSTPSSHRVRPRPTPILGGMPFCVGSGQEFVAPLDSWDPSNLAISQSQQTPSDTMSRPVSMRQDFYTLSMDGSESGMKSGELSASTLTSGVVSWGLKSGDENVEMSGMEAEMGIGQAYSTDDAIPILDLRYQGGQQMDGEGMNFEAGYNPRRMSGSSFTMSTSGGLSDMPSFDDFSTTMSEAPSFSSDYPPPSNRNSLMSSTQLSPVASPRMTPQSRSELVRTQSRGRGASPSPRSCMMPTPYNVETGGRTAKRWSTGTYGTTPNKRQSPFIYHHQHDGYSARNSSRHSSPTIPNHPLPLSYGNLQAIQQHPFLMSQPNPTTYRNSMLLPTQMPSQQPSFDFHHAHQFENPPPLISHGLFRMLQSNGDPHALSGHYADLSDPPDLYSSLNEEQIPPPPEDMNPSDSDLIPHEQDLRFEGDLYTPRWVRGHGNKREGWCGICKPGRWLVLKNSAFWYDKSFTHGISAATGQPFQEPLETRRMDGNPDVWEGLCGSCNDWIALVSSKKKGTTWFRHAYKCHTHPKIKDAPKRRRESSHSRALAASHMAKPISEPTTPRKTPVSASCTTPPATTPSSQVPVPPRPGTAQTPSSASSHQLVSSLPEVPRMDDMPHMV